MRCAELPPPRRTGDDGAWSCGCVDHHAGHRLRVQTHDCAAAWIVALIGDATAADIDLLRAALNPVLARDPVLVVFDLTRVRHLSAAAIGELIATRNRLANRQADTVLAVDCPLLAQQLRRLRLHRLFDIQFTMVPGPGALPSHCDQAA